MKHYSETCAKRHPATPSDIHTRTGRNNRPYARCRRCERIRRYRAVAIAEGAPLCPQGHGMIKRNLGPDGRCAECTPGGPPPPHTWLDWAAVWQALQGLPLVRPLTNYEVLCAITTLCRRNAWNRAQSCNWLRANTTVAVPEDNGNYLVDIWVKRAGVTAISLGEALCLELAPDARLAADSEDEDAA